MVQEYRKTKAPALLQKQLKEKGVSAGIHYPVPLHLQPAYKYLGYKKGSFPVSENAASRILSLPIDGTITDREVEHVVSSIKEINENSVL